MTKFKTSIILGTIISLLLIIFVSCATEDIGLIEQQKQLPLNKNTEEVPVVEETKLEQSEQQSDLALKTNLQEFARKYVRYTTMIQNRLTRSKVDYAELKQLLPGIKNQNDLKIALEKVGIKDSVGIADLTFKAANLIKEFMVNNNPRFSKYSPIEKQDLLTKEIKNAFVESRKEKLRRSLSLKRTAKMSSEEYQKAAQECEDNEKSCMLSTQVSYGDCLAAAYLKYENAWKLASESERAIITMTLLFDNTICGMSEQTDRTQCEFNYTDCEAKLL